LNIKDIVETAADRVLMLMRQLRGASDGARWDSLYFWLDDPDQGGKWLRSTIRSAVIAELGEEARAPKPARPAAKPYQTPTMIRADKVPGVSEQLAAAGGLPAEARAAVALVLPFAAPDDVRWGLNGAHIGITSEYLPGGLGITGPFFAVTTDGHRIGLIGFDCGAQNAEMRELLKDRRRMLYKLDDEGNLEMIEGEFPNFKAVLPSERPARPFALDFDIRKRFNDFRNYVASKTPPEIVEAAERKKLEAEALAPGVKALKESLKALRKTYREERKRIGPDIAPFVVGLTTTEPAGRAKTLASAKLAAAELAGRKKLTWPTHTKGAEAATDFQTTDVEDIALIYRSDRTKAALAPLASEVEALRDEYTRSLQELDAARNAADDGTVLPSWRARARPMTSHVDGRYTMTAPLSDWLKGDAAVFEFGTGKPLGEQQGRVHAGHVGINAPYFHEALSFAAPNAIRSAHPMAPMLFQGDHNRIAVVMPMRLD